MSSRTRKPGWWQLYGLFLLLIPAFVVERHLRVNDVDHEILETSILILTAALIFLWLHANESALIKKELKEGRQRFSAIWEYTPYGSHISEEYKSEENNVMDRLTAAAKRKEL